MTTMDNPRKNNKTLYAMGGNKLKSQAQSLSKTIRLKSGKDAIATRIVVPWDEIKSKTTIHKLNPRLQESLTIESVSDLLESIRESGVDTEGIAIFNEETGLLELVDCSRRAFCCVEAQKDLPLWKYGEIDDSDVLSLVNNTQTGKTFSRRERGIQNQLLMKKNGFSTNQELAEYLGVSLEKVRRENVAASIDSALIELFPDCEAIPVSFYSKLSTFQKKLTAKNIKLNKLIARTNKTLKGKLESDSELTDKHQTILDTLTHEFEILTEKPLKKAWVETELAKFDNNQQYARIKKSPDGRKMTLEFSRIGSEKLEEIQKAIAEIVQK